jgi:hypothetical protein
LRRRGGIKKAQQIVDFYSAAEPESLSLIIFVEPEPESYGDVAPMALAPIMVSNVHEYREK